MDDIRDRWERGYFSYLCSLVDCPDEYTSLLKVLDGIEFRWLLPYDENRCEDGISMREAYGGGSSIRRMGPCTVLEMLVGTLIRADGYYMSHPDGEYYQEWFWDSLANADLLQFTDYSGMEYGWSWDDSDVYGIVDMILERRYGFDGSGGFWVVPGCASDMRERDIWGQIGAWVSHRYPMEIDGV